MQCFLKYGIMNMLPAKGVMSQNIYFSGKRNFSIFKIEYPFFLIQKCGIMVIAQGKGVDVDMRFQKKEVFQISKTEYPVTDASDCVKIELSSKEQSIRKKGDSFMLVLVLIGRIVDMKEIMTTQNDKKVLNFTVANERYDGKENVSDFFQAAAWGSTAEFISQYFKIGQLIASEGTLINNHYEKDGVKQYSEKIFVKQANFAGYNKSDISEKE